MPIIKFFKPFGDGSVIFERYIKPRENWSPTLDYMLITNLRRYKRLTVTIENCGDDYLQYQLPFTDEIV